MKTALEWYIDEMQNFEKGTTEYFSSAAILNHAFRMEKEQIINAYNQADLEGYFQKTYPKYAEEYYNKTYNQNK